MFTLLNPAALLALLGLLVPVAIHLWNRRPGREVAVGSLRWLTAGANRRLRSLKPEQLWLLLLRAALLVVLAVAVAGPVWRTAQLTSRGVVLLSPEVAANSAFATLRPTIDSLRRRGYALRWLLPTFPVVPARQWRTSSLEAPRMGVPGRRVSLPTTESFLWARVQQAAGVFTGQPLYVVASAQLSHLRGPHPPLPTQAPITWQLLPPPPTAWLENAVAVADSLHLLVGQSDENHTIFRQVTMLRPPAAHLIDIAGLPDLRYELASGDGLQLNPVAKPDAAREMHEAMHEAIRVATAPLRVAVFAGPGYAEDARYLRAALRAAALGLPVPLELTAAGTSPTATSLDWLFWLSDAPLPAAWGAAAASKGVRVWQEASGAGTADTTFLAPQPGNTALVRLYRRDLATVSEAESQWTDILGRPVLSRRFARSGIFYRLHTRLLPTWSELADSPALPGLLLHLLRAEPASGVTDRRSLDPAQLLPARPTPGPAVFPPQPAFRFTDLRPGLVLLAGLLFIMERLLARRREAPSLPSTP
ncbi:BatA domain-containing protein [Hymenobacter terricola]|uniref:BatA domain-containing protein n=1 Tax=Hymenobacter terricola TaxID=2819236 RepID=UPI001B30F418|nr:BatA domain-containing protein [Hymenobacter terricola]